MPLKFIVIRGVSGSGKTKRANALVEKAAPSSIAISSDDFFVDKQVVTMGPAGKMVPNYHFDVTKLSVAHAQCRKKVFGAFAKRVELVVLHNTCSRLWEYEDIVVAARLAGYEVEVFEVPCPTRSVLRFYWERNERGVPFDFVSKWWMNWENDPNARMLDLEDAAFRLVMQEIGELADYVPDVIREFRHKIQGAIGELARRVGF